MRPFALCRARLGADGRAQAGAAAANHGFRHRRRADDVQGAAAHLHHQRADAIDATPPRRPTIVSNTVGKPTLVNMPPPTFAISAADADGGVGPRQGPLVATQPRVPQAMSV